MPDTPSALYVVLERDDVIIKKRQFPGHANGNQGFLNRVRLTQRMGHGKLALYRIEIQAGYAIHD